MCSCQLHVSALLGRCIHKLSSVTEANSHCVDRETFTVSSSFNTVRQTSSLTVFASVLRSKKVIKLVPEYLLKKRKAYQAIKANQAKLALLEKRKVSHHVTLLIQDYLATCFQLKVLRICFAKCETRLICTHMIQNIDNVHNISM